MFISLTFFKKVLTFALIVLFAVKMALCSFHLIRHTFDIILLPSGCSIFVLKKIEESAEQ